MGKRITIDMSVLGSAGGKARAARLSSKRKTEIARAAAFKMWEKRRAAALELANRKNGKSPRKATKK